MKKGGGGGQVRRKYKALQVFVLFVGWIHLIIGIGGFLIFMFIEKKPIESTLFFYMAIVGYALLKFYSSVMKYESRISDLEAKLNTKNP